MPIWKSHLNDVSSTMTQIRGSMVSIYSMRITSSCLTVSTWSLTFRTHDHAPDYQSQGFVSARMLPQNTGTDFAPIMLPSERVWPMRASIHAFQLRATLPAMVNGKNELTLVRSRTCDLISPWFARESRTALSDSRQKMGHNHQCI